LILISSVDSQTPVYTARPRTQDWCTSRCFCFYSPTVACTHCAFSRKDGQAELTLATIKSEQRKTPVTCINVIDKTTMFCLSTLLRFLKNCKVATASRVKKVREITDSCYISDREHLTAEKFNNWTNYLVPKFTNEKHLALNNIL